MTLLKLEIEQLKTVTVDNMRVLKKKIDLLTTVVTETMGDMKQLAQKINHKEDTGQVDDKIFTKFNMPIESVEELIGFEDYLKEESNFKSAVSAFKLFYTRCILHYYHIF